MSKRSCGVLMHITSLASPYGIGTLGAEAEKFAEWLKSAGQTYWQVLPIGPTGYGDSPYQPFSSFAGNPLLIDLDELCEQGLLDITECQNADFGADPHYVDYEKVSQTKYALLRKAFAKFVDDVGFTAFQSEESGWLNDYALFTAIKGRFGGKSWTDGENTDIPNPSSRFCLLRLKSGRVLLINQMDSKKRTAMTALLSEDDGKTFPYALLLDNGENNSYPDAVQSEDGTIYLIWDRGRQSAREIVCARITEDDILAGKIVDDGSYCYNIVSKAFLPAKRKNEEPLRSFAEAEKSFISCFIAEVYRDDGVVENLRAAVERSIQAAKTLFTGQ